MKVAVDPNLMEIGQGGGQQQQQRLAKAPRAEAVAVYRNCRGAAESSNHSIIMIKLLLCKFQKYSLLRLFNDDE